jgi:Ca2+-transporting ATPase
MLVRAVVYALAISVVTIAALGWGLRAWPGAPARAITLSFTTLALAQVFHLGNARSQGPVLSLHRALANRFALAALALTIVLQVLAVVLRPLGSVLGTLPLPLHGWLVAVALAAVPALLGQGWKVIRGRERSQSRSG